MYFFRIENSLCEGPYINHCEINLMDWLEMEDVVNPNNWEYDKYMMTHPSPMGRDQELFDFYYKIHNNDRHDLIFGFDSIYQMKKWFSFAKEIEYFLKYDFHVSIYKLDFQNALCDSFIITEYQMVANKNELKLIEQLTIDSVFIKGDCTYE